MSDELDDHDLNFEDHDKRAAVRTAFNARIRVTHDHNEEAFFLTRDISDTGIFVCVSGEEPFPRVGSTVMVQVQGLPIAAPELKMVVTRKSKDGYGLQFLKAYEAQNQE